MRSRRIVTFIFISILILPVLRALPAAAETMEETKARLRAEVREEFGITSPSQPKSTPAQKSRSGGTQDMVAGEGLFLGMPRATALKLLVFMMIVGLVPAAIAKSKKRSFVAWWVLGVIFFIVAFPAALFLKDDKKGKPVKSGPPPPRKHHEKNVILDSDVGEEAGPGAEEERPRDETGKKSSPALEIYEKIEKLASLKDKGVLTPEEFESKKKELLSRI